MLQNIRSIQEHPPLKKWVGLSINWVYPAVEVKVSNSLPAFESISAAHQLVHPALKSTISTEENGEVSSIFLISNEDFDSSSQIHQQFDLDIYNYK